MNTVLLQGSVHLIRRDETMLLNVFKVIDLIERNDVEESFDEPTFEIKRLNEEQRTDLSYEFKDNTLLQWVIIPFLNAGDRAIMQIQIHSQETELFLREHIIPHFEKVEAIYLNGELKEIQIGEMKDSSKKRFQDRAKTTADVSDVIKDFYLKEQIIRTESIQCVDYVMDIKQFRSCVKLENIEEDLSLAKYLKESITLNNGSLFLSPLNWRFDDELLSSSALEYFSRFADRIYVTVNETNGHIRSIELM